MDRGTKTKVALAATSALVALGLAVAARGIPALPWPRGSAAPPATGHVPPLDEARARRFFAIESRPHIQYDPVASIVYTPGTTERWSWEEHPDGVFVREVNERSLNMARPTALAKRGLRVLVAGDSHTAGVVNCEESFCHVTERRLKRALGRRDVEVLNAAVPYTGPTCYLGVLHKHLELDPDVFVAVVFVGNDFLDESTLAQAAGRAHAPQVPPEYHDIVHAVWAEGDAVLAQGLNQAYRYHWFPEEAELALQTSLAAFREMKRACAAHGIALLAVLLPTKMDVDEDDRETWESAPSALGLAPEEAHANLALGRRLFAALQAEGIACLDPTEEMVRSTEVLYWKRDYHLAVRGHALVGRLLGERLAVTLGAPGPGPVR
ncbi:MAG TPA: hypothetical protein VF530_21370 [Planctomycetota bacterium]